jgi:hypothetical protein
MDTSFDPVMGMISPQPKNKYHRNSDKILKSSADLNFKLHSRL